MAARARAAKAPRAESPPDAATNPDIVTGEIKTRVKTLQDGQGAYWRGGQGHTKAWQTWPAGTYSAEQIERLKADERVEVEAV